MRLWAISDLHISHPANRDALDAMPARPEDWLIIAGDVGDRPDHLDHAFGLLKQRFAGLVWTPGNHELWTLPSSDRGLRGEALYASLVEIARRHGVVTPEDPYPIVDTAAGTVRLVPMFLLYDYSFRPAHIARSKVIDWAMETNCVCMDEYLLHPSPFPDRDSWCAERCAKTEHRLAGLGPAIPNVLINHYPLMSGHAILPRIPRFTPWCGTTRSEDWHRRFNARAVVYGHLHIRRIRWTDGVPFQEVSLGYPRQWNQTLGIGSYLHEVVLADP